MEKLNNYPNVLIHGFGGYGEDQKFNAVWNYWGKGDNNLLKHLRSEGYEVYSPNVGLVTGAWDRCCEIWAYLFGGTVDYGVAHSRECGHSRYGRTYEHGVLEDLGKTEEHKKMNLFGHSFGGTTVLLMQELMTNGSEAEREATDPDDLSPLFAGGHGNLLHVVSTHTGVLNGTTMASFGKPFLPLLSSVMLGAMELLENTPFMKVLDMGQQQFGLGAYPEETPYGIGVNPPKQTLEGIKAYSKDGLDNIYQEMSIDFRQENNQNIGVNPHVYYFANRTCASKPGPNGHQISTEGVGSYCKPYAAVMNIIKPQSQVKSLTLDDSWAPHDGFVKVVGQSGPLNLPSEEGDFGMDFKPGIWYNMPILPHDHVFWNGWSAKPGENFPIWDKLLELYCSLPDA